MPAHRKYDCSADIEQESRRGALPEHRLVLGDFRGFTPSESEQQEDGAPGGLASGATGDWAWKPGRYPILMDRPPHFGMPTYRAACHQRACRGCGLTSCLSLITHVATVCA